MISLNLKEIIIYVIRYIGGMLWSQKVIMVALTLGVGFSIYSGLVRRKERMTGLHVFGIFVLSCSISAIFVATLTGRVSSDVAVWKWKPFWSYVACIKESDSALFAQIAWNILAFIPIGFLLPIYFDVFKKYRYMYLVVVCLTCIVEIIQGLTRIGWFEVDDIFNNFLGTVIGVGFYEICGRLWKKRNLLTEESNEKT